jgi:ribonuclease HI
VDKGWARKWRRNNWKKSDGQKALNPDLWTRLLDLCDLHQVKFVWVRGHAGHPENERCDEMATSAAAGEGLPADEEYELLSVSCEERLSL